MCDAADEVGTAAEPVAGWITELGIVDRSTGLEKARDSLQRVHKAAKATIRAPLAVHPGHLLLMGLLTRAVGLHGGAVGALESNNPYTAFTLIRAYAENAAITIYAIDKPQMIDRLVGLATPPVSIGQITNYAQRGSKRFGAFREVYSELSQFAHPLARSIFASTKLTGARDFEWSTAPEFKSEADFLTACGWTVEMARANATLLLEFGTLLNANPAPIQDRPPEDQDV